MTFTTRSKSRRLTNHPAPARRRAPRLAVEYLEDRRLLAAPVAADDSYAIDWDQPLAVTAPGVLANDADADDDVLAATQVSPAAFGAVTLGADGAFDYTPPAGFNGWDYFVYEVNDGATAVQATVYIAMSPAYAVEEDGIVDIVIEDLRPEDGSVTGPAPVFALLDAPANGTLTDYGNGTLTYTPNPGFHGADWFSYTFEEGGSIVFTSNVTLTVNPVNDPPVAGNDSYTLDEDGSLSVVASGVLANDTDADGDALSAWLLSGPYGGTATLEPDGSLSYVPAADFFGTDYILYTVCDAELCSDGAAITLTVNPTADAPWAEDDAFAMNQDEVLTVDAVGGVLANDGDVDGDAVTAALVSPPGHGSLTFNSDGSFSYVPHPGFSGTDWFSYVVNDSTADGNVANVYLEVYPVPVVGSPVGGANEYAVNEDSTLIVAAAGVLTNDSDPQGDPLHAALLQGPANGTLALNADGSFRYVPSAEFSGWDFFVYAATDGTDSSPPVTVSVLVNSVNDVGRAGDDAYTVSSGGLTVSKPGVLGNDRDVDGTLTARLVTGPAHGTLTLQADGTFTYTPAAGFVGTDTFTYRANDGTADTNVATVTLTVPAPPSGGGGSGGSTPTNPPLSAEAQFIHNLYLDMLGRPPDVVGLNGWVATLQNGVPRDTIARAFWRSAEHRARQVDEWYVTFLHRPADDGGRAVWVNAMLAGVSDTAIMQGFLTSPEYQMNHQSNADFIAGMYQDVLGRPADAAGMAGWTAALQAGASRAAAALSFLTSGEGYGRQVDLMYTQFLGRGAGPEEEQAWAALLQTGGVSLEDVAALILGSPEYYSQA